MPEFFVGSEVGKLRKVMVHRPDLELNRLTPSNHDELLFDDVLWVKKARQQHDVFVDHMRDRGVRVFYLEKLLAEALAIPEALTAALEATVTEYTVGAGAVHEIRQAMAARRLFSMILWGPPGCGKTTLARLIARASEARFVEFSAVLSGVKDIRQVIQEARQLRDHHHRQTLLFVDEIHRFNKAQQDAFLHHVETGLITLIGATTENPSFEVIPALMSRCRVVVLQPHDPESLTAIIRQALADKERGVGRLNCRIDPEALALARRIEHEGLDYGEAWWARRQEASA